MKEFGYRLLSGVVGFILGCVFIAFLAYKSGWRKEVKIPVTNQVQDTKIILDTIRIEKTKPIYVVKTKIRILNDTIYKDSLKTLIEYLIRDSIRVDSVFINYPVQTYSDTLEYNAYNFSYNIIAADLQSFSYGLDIKKEGIKGYTLDKPYYIGGKLGLNTIGIEGGFKNYGIGVLYNTQSKWIPFISYTKRFKL